MQDARDIFTVSRLNREVRGLLEQNFPSVWLVGEISNFSRPGSGHWYFTLKDEQAQISCAMFRGNNMRVQAQVANGMQVMVRARISLYEPRGNYQIIVEHLEPAGVGLLQQQYEELKAKLASEGLFAQERKKPIPSVQKLGIVTSATGAALKDVLAVLRHRDPSIHIIVYPAQVQGTEAPKLIRQALATAIARNEVDAILLTRGGGSLEDLWAFNDEQLARDIANSPIPTLSAVGHEIDFTIADFVADLRAATPSQAAELLSADRQHHIQNLNLLRQRCWRALNHILSNAKHKANYLQSRLMPLNPKFRIERQAQQLDELSARLQRSIQHRLRQEQTRTTQLQHRLGQQHPERAIKVEQELAQKREQRLMSSMVRLLNEKRRNLTSHNQALHLVSPLNVLNRGYSLTFDENNKIVKKVDDLQIGKSIETRLGQGRVVSTITAIKPE
ncbi:MULTISPECIES: exodeoxyribonuclease VII large subunit [Gammaproteobacteria]|uniref:exodeoxyribonuclease VII large subunit n=1 Tax=Gammaproteobacteria TaxID=1236 RepID=UPI000DD071CC|nr:MULTISPECIES: exodeoxyribonuclease VII large subunit [Gammaproteobacteria]RTE86193.1 exodeoxyribonuclease VII large subunit [Aliidiomarina sp. B3213]TCZ91545.1 exodeoxyribonuclease VII large subunit [Lysobacter sp. N42]